MKKFLHIKDGKKGFSLVEMIVSLSIFVTVMIIVMGAVLSVLDLNRKSQSEKTAMDNLNFTLDSLSRTIRFGQNYHCGITGIFSQPLDCQSGSTPPVLILQASDGSTVTYSLLNGALMRSINGASPVALTSSDIIIQALAFRVIGSYPYGSGSNQDFYQPQVIITISGLAGSPNKPKDQTSFRLETTISQRKLDI